MILGASTVENFMVRGAGGWSSGSNGEPSDRPHQLRWAGDLTAPPWRLGEASRFSACICRGLRESAFMCPRATALAEIFVSRANVAFQGSERSLGRQRGETSRERLIARERA